jgi:hypothetical protein
LIVPVNLTSNLRFRATDLRGTECTALLEALSAEDWTSLCRPEGNRGVLTALGASGLCFRAHLRGPAASTSFSALGLAALAPFRLILETFVGEKHLLAGSKNKLSAALRTLQDPVVVFHEPLPLPESGRGMCTFRNEDQVL